LRARALNGVGCLAYQLRDYARAQAVWEEGRAVWERLGDRVRAAVCVGNLAWAARTAGDNAAARRLCEEALAVFREHGDQLREANGLYALGWLLADAGEYALARDVATRALEIYEDLGAELNAAECRINLAWSVLKSGEPGAARALFTQTLAQVRDGDASDRALECLEGLAMSAACEGEAERAFRLVAAAEHWRAVLGRPRNGHQTTPLRVWLDPLVSRVGDQVGAAASAEGRAMRFEDAVVYALGVQETRPEACAVS
jgi:tetratricopeptide (TPR) repeat protein